MPRVLHLVDHIGLGGAQRIVAGLAGLDGHHVHALRATPNDLDVEGSIEKESTSRRYSIRGIGKVYSRMENFDILHAHLMKSKIFGAVVKKAGRDFELVFHEHGRIMDADPFYTFFLELADNVVDRYIAVSRHTAGLLEEQGIDGEKIDVVYNFADREKFKPGALEERDRIESEGFTVGFAGRLIEKKGWRTMVEAADQLEDIDILMAGAGPGEGELEQATRKRENIRFLGHLDDIRDLLAAIDLLVIPSKQEACPMILFEARACGVPVACSDTDSMNELVDDGVNGLVFPEGDARELARAVERARDRDTRRKITEGGLEFAENHTLERYAENLENSYSRLGT